MGSTPTLTPIATRGRGPSGRVALGGLAVVLVALVGISLIDQAGGGAPPSEAAVAPSTASATPAASSFGPRSAFSPLPPATSLPAPEPPPPRVGLAVGAAAECPPGSSPDEPGRADQARPPLGSGSRMAFDRRRGRIVVLADDAPHGTETWAFDVCTNTWAPLRTAGEPAGDSLLVYDVDSDALIAIDRDARGVWVYDAAKNAWEARKRAGPGPSARGILRLAYDPVSGLVVVLEATSSGAALWAYDVEADAWTRLPEANRWEVPGDPPQRRLLAYDAAVDRLVAYGSVPDGTRLYDPRTGRWSRAGAVTPRVMFGWAPSGGEIAYDEAIERTVVFSYGRVVAYDASADRWDVLVPGWDPDRSSDPNAICPRPACRSEPWMVYDPVNRRLVIYGGRYPGDAPWVQADDVLAFDPTTRRWTTLVAASADTAGPSPVPATPAPAPPSEPDVVIIAAGDTLWGIARARGVPVQSILDANPQLDDPRMIHAGDRVAVPRCVAPPDGLSAWWTGDGTASDRLGGQGARLVGARYGPGIVGAAFVLDGESDYVDVLDATALDVAGEDFGISLWVRFDDTVGEQVLAEKWVQTFDAAPTTGWTLTKLASDQLRFVLAGVGQVDTPPIALTPGTWYQVAARRRGSELAVLVDGVVMASEWADASSTRDLSTPSSLKFGHRGAPADTPGSQDTSGFYLDGAIDEVQLSIGRAPSDEEIARLFAAGAAGSCWYR